MDWVWTILAIVIMGLLAWVGFKIEPHWSSKDGRRFLCSGQLLSVTGEPLGRWRETNVVIGRDGSIMVEQKRMMLRRHGSTWTLAGESPDPPNRRAVFLLKGHDDDGRPAMMALKLPENSKALPTVREQLQR